MNPINNKLYRFTLWLVRLRWLGVLCIVLVTFVSSRLLEISVHEFILYIVSAVFLLMNVLYRLWLSWILQMKDKDPTRRLRLLINFQISTDFIALTIMLHYSGGIENPYYALEGFVSHDLYQSKIYLIASGIIFITTSYLVVYITNSIVMRSRRHEEAYMKINLELEKKDEIKNEYVLRITHDIKGHLAAIQSSLNVLNIKTEGSNSQESKGYLETASRRTSILIRFVKDLLYITKQKLSSEFITTSFSIRELMHKIIASLESSAKIKSIRIRLEPDENVDQIKGYQLSIAELITNLLSNAIQYSYPDTEVCIKVKALVKEVLIEILDNGPGIPDQEKELVFQEFYRGSNIKNISEGTGLGLAIANMIVKTHGGRIWVENGETKGSKFCFTLPFDNHTPV